MTNRYARVLAGALGASAAYVGVWATIWPHSFYTSFPGLGHTWVAPLGPYNEHLARDVGALYLALLVVSAWATWRPHPGSLRVVGAPWLVFGVPHQVFHVGHRDRLPESDRVKSLIPLAAAVLGATLLALTRDPQAGTRRRVRTGEEVAR